MYTYEHKIRVRYGETDQMGVVYYGNYPLYYEEARTESIRQLGVPYTELEAKGIMMPVARMNIKYVLPAKYDEELRIRSSITEMPNRSITFLNEIFNEEDYLINIGETVLLFMDTESRKARRAPEFLLEKLRPFFEE